MAVFAVCFQMRPQDYAVPEAAGLAGASNPKGGRRGVHQGVSDSEQEGLLGTRGYFRILTNSPLEAQNTLFQSRDHSRGTVTHS